MLVSPYFTIRGFIFIVNYLIIFLIFKFAYAIGMQYTWSTPWQITLDAIGSILGLPISTSVD